MQLEPHDHVTVRAALRRLLHQHHAISEDEARAAAEGFGIPPEEVVK